MLASARRRSILPSRARARMNFWKSKRRFHCAASAPARLERDRLSFPGKTFMRTLLSTLFADNLGVTVIEYAMLASLVAIVAVAAKASIGASVSGFFASVSSGL